MTEDCKSNTLLEEYLIAFTKALEQVIGNPIENLEQAKKCVINCDILPLGFGTWFQKHGAKMLSQLSRSDFSEGISDEFLDELDYYLAVLRKDTDEHNIEFVCSDLVTSLTKLSKASTLISKNKQTSRPRCLTTRWLVCFLTCFSMWCLSAAVQQT